VVLVLDSGRTWGGSSSVNCIAHEGLGCTAFETEFTESRWEELKQSLADTVRNSTYVPNDGSMAIAVVQGTGAELRFDGMRDWTAGPRVEIPLRHIVDLEAAEALALDILDIDRYTGPLNQCEPAEGTICYPFEQFLPGPSIDVASNLLDHPDKASRQTVCLVGDVDSGGGWVGYFTTTGAVPAHRTVLDAHQARIASEPGRALRVVDYDEEFPPPFDDLFNSRPLYQALTTDDGGFLSAPTQGDVLIRIGSGCFGAPVDLKAIEVNQAVQDLGNNVQLYEGKATGVRVYFTREPNTDPGPLYPLLVGRRNNKELEDSPLPMINTEPLLAPLQLGRKERKNPEWSAQFVLPDSWTNVPGDIELSIEGVVSSCANQCKTTPTLVESTGARFQVVGTKWTGSDDDEHATTLQTLWELEGRIAALVPDGKLEFLRGANLDNFVASGQLLNNADFKNLIEAVAAQSFLRSSYLASWCLQPGAFGAPDCSGANNFVSMAALVGFVPIDEQSPPPPSKAEAGWEGDSEFELWGSIPRREGLSEAHICRTHP
jgi:hypothetical protein